MKVTQRQDVYNIELDAGEAIEVSIDGNAKFSRTVPAGATAIVQFRYTEE